MGRGGRGCWCYADCYLAFAVYQETVKRQQDQFCKLKAAVDAKLSETLVRSIHYTTYDTE
jgi:hypothetical protein